MNSTNKLTSEEVISKRDDIFSAQIPLFLFLNTTIGLKMKKPLFTTQLGNDSFNKLYAFDKIYREKWLNVTEEKFNEKYENATKIFKMNRSYEYPTSEKDSSVLFEKTLDPTIGLFKVAEFNIETSGKFIDSLKTKGPLLKNLPSLIYSEKNKGSLFVDIKDPKFSSFFHNKSLKSDNFEFQIMIENVYEYFIAFKTTRGIISDFITTLFVEIDEAKLDELLKTSGDSEFIPLKYRVLGFGDVNVTVHWAFGSWLFDAVSDDAKKDREKQEQVIEKLKNYLEPDDKRNFLKAKTFIDEYCSGKLGIDSKKAKTQIIGKSESWSEFEILKNKVYKLRVDSICNVFPIFNNVLSHLKPNDLVVMKFYIPDVLAKIGKLPNTPFGLHSTCIQECFEAASCFELIKKHNSTVVDENEIINTPTLYNYGSFKLNVKDLDEIVGYYLLLSYVESEKPRVDNSVVESGCKQLESLRKIGLEPKAIDKENCKIVDGRVVFLDFSWASKNYLKSDKSENIKKLKQCF